MRLLFVTSWLLGGCEPSAPTDEQRYRDALSGPLDGAAGTCGAIAEPRLRGDCQSAAATRLAASGRYPDAQQVCDAILDPLWHDECWFGISDAAGLLGEEAAHACKKANRYQIFCRRHTLQRAAAQMEVAVGEEPEAIRRYGRLVEELLAVPSAEVQQHTANTLLTERLSERWREQPFDPALCGALTPTLCRHAYWYTATQLLGEMRAVCDDPPIRSSATEAVGLSGYTEAGAPIAEAVWADLCQQIASGDLAPAEIGAAVPADLDGGMLPME